MAEQWAGPEAGKIAVRLLHPGMEEWMPLAWPLVGSALAWPSGPPEPSAGLRAPCHPVFVDGGAHSAAPVAWGIWHHMGPMLRSGPGWRSKLFLSLRDPGVRGLL